MRKIRDVLRFHMVGGVRSSRKIGKAVGCGKTAVLDLIGRAPALGINTWADVEGLDDEALERVFYPDVLSVRGPRIITQPDWKKFNHCALKDTDWKALRAWRLEASQALLPTHRP